MKDMRGVEIKVGYPIIYGVSSRNSPIQRGTVHGVCDGYIEVIRVGGKTIGRIPEYNLRRVMVIPKEYLQDEQ